jgi:hypothetical protein
MIVQPNDTPIVIYHGGSHCFFAAALEHYDHHFFFFLVEDLSVMQRLKTRLTNVFSCSNLIIAAPQGGNLMLQ